MKMLSPEVNIRLIAPKRRNVGNPWFKRGTLYRAVIDLLRKATGPMTADDICKVLLGREAASRHPEAGEQPTGGNLGCATGAQGWRGNRGRRAATLAIERDRQLRRPLKTAPTGGPPTRMIRVFLQQSGGNLSAGGLKSDALPSRLFQSASGTSGNDRR
jgi:hypothetical protein